VRTAKAEYYQETFRNITKPNSAWRNLRHLGLFKPKTSERKLAFSVEELNEFFCDIGVTINDPLMDLNPIYLEEVTYNFKFYWNNIKPVHIVKALRRCKSGSVGVNGIAPELLNKTLPYILPVTHIFNFCLSAGVYPDSWSTAIIYPIPTIKNPSALITGQFPYCVQFPRFWNALSLIKYRAYLRIHMFSIPINQLTAEIRLLILHSLECLMMSDLLQTSAKPPCAFFSILARFLIICVTVV